MRMRCACAAVVAVFLFVGVPVRAQSGGAVSGRLLNSLSGDAIPGATVVIEELRRQTTSAADGSRIWYLVSRMRAVLSARSMWVPSRMKW